MAEKSKKLEFLIKKDWKIENFQKNPIFRSKIENFLKNPKISAKNRKFSDFGQKSEISVKTREFPDLHTKILETQIFRPELTKKL